MPVEPPNLLIIGELAMSKHIRVEIVVAIIALAVVLHAAIVQYGAIKIAEVDGRTDAAVAGLVRGTGKTEFSAGIQRHASRSLEENVPDAAPALNTLAGGGTESKVVKNYSSGPSKVGR
jgi:hypothetical protein